LKNTIFYFSGTGNSLQIAKDLSNILENYNVINIAEYNDSDSVEYESIVLVFPVYFWGIPHIVERFIKRVNLKNNSYVYAIANYGLWPGKALEIVRFILEMRGIHLNAGFLVKMPDNYILWYGARSFRKQSKCFQKESKKINIIAKKIALQQNNPLEKSKFVIDRLFTYPINRINRRKFSSIGNEFMVNKNCQKCGQCVRRCPTKNIVFKENELVRNNCCELCLACIQYCPVQAINYKNKTQNRKRYVNPNIEVD
jgi:ferredoxin